jgi:MerR family transcriptional regulator, heat shock protein HspR
VNESRRSPRPLSHGLPENRAAESRLAALADADAPLYTVGQAAEVLGTQPAALRRLDAAGVIVPGRTSGGQRRYSRNQLERALRIQEYIAGGASTALAAHVVDLEDQVSNLAAQIRDLTGLPAAPGRGTTPPSVPNPREG